MERSYRFASSFKLPYALLFVLLSACNFIFFACTQEGVECLADSACSPGLVCVSTKCVNATVTGEPEQLFTEEFHARLARDCGICHGVAGEIDPQVEAATYAQGVPASIRVLEQFSNLFISHSKSAQIP